LSARTLCDKSITFDGKELPYPDNKVSFTDYISDNTIETTVYLRDDVMNAFFEKRIPLFGVAHENEMISWKVIFDGLILNSKNDSSNTEIEYINKDNLTKPNFH